MKHHVRRAAWLTFVALASIVILHLWPAPVSADIVDIDPDTITIAQGESDTVSIEAFGIHPRAETCIVVSDISPTPHGLNVNLTDPCGISQYTATATVTADADAPLGTFTVSFVHEFGVQQTVPTNLEVIVTEAKPNNPICPAALPVVFIGGVVAVLAGREARRRQP